MPTIVEFNLETGERTEREMTPEEIAALPEDVADHKAEAQAYLLSTDWYVVRFAETGVAIPDEVKKKRAEARLTLD